MAILGRFRAPQSRPTRRKTGWCRTVLHRNRCWAGCKPFPDPNTNPSTSPQFQRLLHPSVQVSTRIRVTNTTAATNTSPNLFQRLRSPQNLQKFMTAQPVALHCCRLRSARTRCPLYTSRPPSTIPQVMLCNHSNVTLSVSDIYFKRPEMRPKQIPCRSR